MLRDAPRNQMKITVCMRKKWVFAVVAALSISMEEAFGQRRWTKGSGKKLYSFSCFTDENWSDVFTFVGWKILEIFAFNFFFYFKRDRNALDFYAMPLHIRLLLLSLVFTLFIYLFKKKYLLVVQIQFGSLVKHANASNKNRADRLWVDFRRRRMKR